MRSDIEDSLLHIETFDGGRYTAQVTTRINEMPEVVCRNELRYWKLRDYSWPEFAPECFKQYCYGRG